MVRNTKKTRTLKDKAGKMLTSGNLAGARDVYNRICRLDTQDAKSWQILGAIYGELGNYENAVACSRKAIHIQPNYLEAYNNLGSALELEGKLREALDTFNKALKICANPGKILGSLSRIHEKLGETEKSHELIQSILSANITDVNAAITFSNICQEFGQCDEAISYINKLLANGHQDPRETIMLHFSLGNIYDKAGEYDLAFRNFQAANDAKPIIFDAVAHEYNIGCMISTYTREHVENMPRAANRSEIPVFIVGMLRSGTSLVEQILSRHSMVYGAGELTCIQEIAISLVSGPGKDAHYIHNLCDWSDSEINRQAEKHLQRLQEFSPDAMHITDKLPHNFLYLGLIAALFPGCRVINCQRDPLDTCLSNYFLDFEGDNPQAYSLHNLGHFYNQYVRLMDHWKSVLDIPILDVQYEDLVNSPDRLIPVILEFLGLEWEDQCVNFHESTRVTRTASYRQVRCPIYTSSVGRWKNYDKFLGPLKSALHIK